MIRSILLCTDGSPHGDTACEYAIHLATRMKARLNGLHVLDARVLEGPLLADISGWIGAQPYGAQLLQFRDLMKQKGEAVMAAFAGRCQQAGIPVETSIKMGHPARVILEEEARAELVILGQKGEHAGWIGDLTGSTIERVSRHSVKPCLVTPASFRPITRILAGYDGSAHGSQALHEAIELAEALNVELVIVTVAEGDAQDKARKIADDARKLVDAHERRALSTVVTGRPATAILDQARDEDCNFIVVGAYGHSRIREMILGSTTTHLLTRSHIPVLLVR